VKKKDLYGNVGTYKIGGAPSAKHNGLGFFFFFCWWGRSSKYTEI
jgi:hypothetical protein